LSVEVIVYGFGCDRLARWFTIMFSAYDCVMQPRDANQQDNGRRSWQFRLSELFVFITVAAVVFAMIGRWGWTGTIERLEAAMFVGGVCAAAMEIHHRIKETLGQ